MATTVSARAPAENRTVIFLQCWASGTTIAQFGQAESAATDENRNFKQTISTRVRQ
jgi:hypothetical protein